MHHGKRLQSYQQLTLEDSLAFGKHTESLSEMSPSSYANLCANIQGAGARTGPVQL